MSKIIKQNTFTDRLLITKILMDASREIVLIGKFFNLDTGKYHPYQIVCDPDVFTDIIVSLEATNKPLFDYLTDSIPHLTEEPFAIGAPYIPSKGLIVTDAIFVLGPLEWYSEAREKFVYKFPDLEEFDEKRILVQIDDERPTIPTKLDLCYPSLILFDYLPGKPPFDPRQHWIKDINDNPKFLPFANQVYLLQLKYYCYLYLRSRGNPHKSSKMVCGIRELRVFNLAKTFYALSSNPRKFEPW